MPEDTCTRIFPIVLFVITACQKQVKILTIEQGLKVTHHTIDKQGLWLGLGKQFTFTKRFYKSCKL